MSEPTPRVVIQDTNLLLLFLVGETDPSLIDRWKRVDTFDITDLRLLGEVLRPFAAQMTTPHILSEVSNFVDQAPPYRRADLVRALSRLATQRAERYEQSARLVMRQEFSRLALTDTGLVSLSTEVVIITTDFRLAHQIALSGGHAINFNHLRGKRLIPHA